MHFLVDEADILTGRHMFKKNDGIRHNNIHHCDFAFLLNDSYIGIDISSLDQRVYGISGYIALEKFAKEVVNMPKSIKKGALYVADCDLIPGTAKVYSIPAKMKYDKKKRCICFGDDYQASEAVRISEDVLIVVNEGQITAIYIALDNI